VLSRELAEAGHYPAIDVQASISRVMSSVTPEEHQTAALTFKRLWTHYHQNQDLIKMGMYKSGADPVLDHAIALYEPMRTFLQQTRVESASMQESLDALYQNFA
jgi:flagellum-specific ATP synthase